jgi:hypothetical protein
MQTEHESPSTCSYSPGTRVRWGKASRFVSGVAGSASGSADRLSWSGIRSSTWRSRKARSSSRFRRSQPVTSSLHLLVLQDGQAGTTFSSVYRPPRESGSTQSRCSGLSVAPQ